MKIAEGVPWVAPLLVAAGLALAVPLAALAAWSDAKAARVIGGAPRATLASPAPTPAVYRGRVFAREPRSTPRGTRGAVLWWWTGKTVSRNRQTSCGELASGSLVLRDAGHEARVDMLDDRRGPALLADARSEPFRPLAIDLGPVPLHVGDIPKAIARCDGPNYEYQERVLADGAEVEIFGCWRDGAIEACSDSGPITGVLGVPGVERHAWRRSQGGLVMLRVVAVAGLLALITLAVLAGRSQRRRHATELRPEPGA